MRLLIAFMIFVHALFGTSMISASGNPYRIEYQTPQKALKALKKRKDVETHEENDWILINDKDAATDKKQITFWSITTKKNPAHPTAVKRVVYERDGAVYLAFDMQCGTKKEICEEVYSYFKKSSENLKASFKSISK
jgi:hypothetical protein